MTAVPPATKATEPSLWNVANGLTTLRVALVPVFAWLLLDDAGEHTAYRWAAFAVFLLAVATDRIDGDIARRRGLVTNFGKVVDPLADKALTGTAFVALSVLGELPWAVTVLVLGREVGVTLLRLWVIRHGVIPASHGGKVKQFLQCVALSGYILPLTGVWHQLAVAAMVAAVVVTLATGLDYVFRALALRRNSRTEQQRSA